MTTSVSLADLRRWEDNGATWRALELDPDYVIIEMCTCYGEPVELGRAEDADVVEYVTRRRSSEAPAP